MSLFPAYCEDNECVPAQTKAPDTTSSTAPTNEWLENDSFAIDIQKLAKATHPSSAAQAVGLDSSSDDSQDSNSSSGSDYAATDKEPKSNRKSAKKQSKKRQRSPTPPPAPAPLLDFSGNEEFYVDKNKAKQYCAIKTLHKPACPRYRSYYRTLGRRSYNIERHKYKRYYRHKQLLDDTAAASNGAPKYPLTEEEYTNEMRALNRKTLDNCTDVQHWLDIIELQDRNPYKWSRLRTAEKKLDYLEKALNFNKYNQRLYEEYINIITQCYTSHDVSKMLDSMLLKDANSFTLWQAQIMCTQGTMARCTVPEVLRIYERCMKKMFRNQNESIAGKSSQVSDAVMMRLFYNCALFLRQSGLYEQFFALIKLAIELNVPVSGPLLESMQPRAQDEHTLVEYEELILQSGLPMNEIWLRIERLRQGFFFLPFPGENAKCSDPQRIVFNEDVCHYVYPLETRENSFKLLLLITKLLKVPLGHRHLLAAELEGDTDAIEDMLGILTLPHYHWHQDQWQFFESLNELAKEMAVNPTYLSNSIGHEIYADCVQKFLLNCAQSYEQVDERKRLAFLMLWCRFQRLLLVLEKLNKKLKPEFCKQVRQRFKSLLKQRQNRNSLPLYAEFALYEHAAESGAEVVAKIFKNLIQSIEEEDAPKSEMSYVYLAYAEILLESQDLEQVSQLLASYALACAPETITNARKLAALNAMKEKLQSTMAIEENVEIMTLEQHLLPDNTINQIKIYCLLLYALNQKQQALEYVQAQLARYDSSTNARHKFLREQCCELYICLLQLPGGNSYVSHTLIQRSIQSAIQRYDNNLFFLQKWGCQASMPWYKLRSGFTGINPSIKSVIYMIALARCRFINHLVNGSMIHGDSSGQSLTPTDLSYHETLVRQRILNLFKTLAPEAQASAKQTLNISLRRNALFWRCYLRCLSDQNCSFETGKQCLLTALDECPWSKALYLDGATYVPQELTHLQDLIIEKQLRIYALPEELEILRER